jgi:GTP:adenosylcobinamide-phosphate guanylyltransferase
MEGLILAGAVADAGLQQAGVQRVPLLRVGGQTILERTARALAEGGGCTSIVVLAPEEVPLPDVPGVVRGRYTGELIADLTAAVKGMSGAATLVATGDMPLITAEAVGAIARYAADSGAELVYPVVEKAVMDRRGLGEHRTYRRFGDRTLTACNLFYMDREWIVRQEPLLRDLFAKRKDPLALAKFFGAGFLFKVMRGNITLEYAQDYLSKKVGAKLKAPTTDYAELAADLDKLDDLRTFAPHLDPGQFQLA